MSNQTTSSQNHENNPIINGNLVNASDLDVWVKRADEYREMYMKTEM